MPLPESTARTEVHLRRIEMRGYRRDDGLYEIDGRVVDTKSHALNLPGDGRVLPPGQPIHDMWVRLVVDEFLEVRDVVAVTDASPFAVCREAVAPMRAIIGERIEPGWSMMVKARLGGAAGCTHLMELLLPMATAAYQTLSSVRLARPDVTDATGRPVKIDSCYAYAKERDLVRLRWPAFHRGAEHPEPPQRQAALPASARTPETRDVQQDSG
jgi:hypothetical protein